tara:strand:+ start:315 stop:1307 length:993 start_codon:yes stop_codon:yes gene_type:complete
MASIGFGRNKQKSQTSGTSEVSPYAPTEGAIGEIINQAGNLYNQGQPDFLGGFDYSNDLFADPTNQMLALESQGANLFNNLTPTSTDALSSFQSAIAGQPTGVGADYLTNLFNQSQSGSSVVDALAQGGGTDFYSQMSQPYNQFQDDFMRNTANQAKNLAMNELAGMGRFDVNSGAFGDTFGSAFGEVAIPQLLADARLERGIEADALRDLGTNQYNAGMGLAGLLGDASSNVYNAQTNALLGFDDAISNLTNLAGDTLDTSYGFAGMPNMRQDRINELDLMASVYGAGSPLANLQQYANIISPFAFGFPTTISSGTQSGKSSGFGFGIG